MNARTLTEEKCLPATRRTDFNTSRNEFAVERARTARRTVPELIDLLESEVLRTRFLAEMCLRDATNT